MSPLDNNDCTSGSVTRAARHPGPVQFITRSTSQARVRDAERTCRHAVAIHPEPAVTASIANRIEMGDVPA